MEVDKVSPDQFLSQQQAQAPQELKAWWEKLAKAYDRKLWHNVTLLLFEFTARQDSGPYLLSLFEHFVVPIEKKLNPLKLVQIARRVSREIKDDATVLEFLLDTHSRVPSPQIPAYADPASSEYDASKSYTPPPPPAAEAYAFSLTNVAYAQLLNHHVVESKKALDECEAVLDKLENVDGKVMGGFYGVSADYHKTKAAYVPFYKNALLFLACINLEELTLPERIKQAYELGVAALLGDKLYNFGELLQHPILESLQGSEYEWIKQLLFIFNAGDIGKYETLQHKVQEEPILASEVDSLQQKICLMALIEAVFRRPRTQRAMPFQTIAEETRLPVEQVEHLVMKALSLGLVKGSIDQVNSIANIYWVQPRVLDADQSAALYARLSEWSDKVGQVGENVGGWRQPLGVVA